MTGLRWLTMDLHVHTVLSACAEIEMIAPLIVERALELGLAAIAVTDHNCIGNALAVRAAADGSGLTVFPGMELQTREEVHLVALMADGAGARALQQAIDAALPDLPNRPEYFGEQLLVDARGEPVGLDGRLRQASTRLSLEQAVAAVHAAGGLCLAAHLDRPAYSLVGQLGFVPADLPLDGLEVSRHCDPAAFARGRTDLAGLAVVANGDAHRLSEMTARTAYLVGGASLGELSLALRGERGRRVCVRESDFVPLRSEG